MIAIFIIIFLFSYSYRLGGYYYDIIPWVFFTGMLVSIASVVGILMLPLALIYQTLFYYKLTFLPISFTSLFTILVVVLLIAILIMKKEQIKKGKKNA